MKFVPLGAPVPNFGIWKAGGSLADGAAVTGLNWNGLGAGCSVDDGLTWNGLASEAAGFGAVGVVDVEAAEFPNIGGVGVGAFAAAAGYPNIGGAGVGAFVTAANGLAGRASSVLASAGVC